MLDIIKHQQWIVIALAFFGILAYIVIIRWRDRKWIDERFGNPNLRAMSFGVNYFGSATEPGKPRRSSGWKMRHPPARRYGEGPCGWRGSASNATWWKRKPAKWTASSGLRTLVEMES